MAVCAPASNKIDVGTLTAELYGAFDLETLQQLTTNTPIRIAARDGTPGGSFYTLPSPFVADARWIRASQGGMTLKPAVQNRPAACDVPAGNRLSFGFADDGTIANPYLGTVMYRMVHGNQFIPGRRHRISGRAIDQVASNNSPLRFTVHRAQLEHVYTIPSLVFDFPAEFANSCMYMGVGMLRGVAFGLGSAGTYQGFRLADFRIELLPAAPSSVSTGVVADLVQREAFDKNTGKSQTSTS